MDPSGNQWKRHGVSEFKCFSGQSLPIQGPLEIVSASHKSFEFSVLELYVATTELLHWNNRMQ